MTEGIRTPAFLLALLLVQPALAAGTKVAPASKTATTPAPSAGPAIVQPPRSTSVSVPTISVPRSKMSPGVVAKMKRYVATAKRMIESDDPLGFRCLVKRLYVVPLDYTTWAAIRDLITSNVTRVGYDISAYWNSRNSQMLSNIDLAMQQADQLMLDRKFGDAFERFQRIARFLKNLREAHLKDAQLSPEDRKNRMSEVDHFLPFVFQSMGRALYGAGRFEEALKVYNWINPNFPMYSQVLFEKTWAAFRSEHADLALGAIASHNSAYFSRYLPPESYLVQTYLLRKLCRKEELLRVEREIKAYQAMLERNSWKEWAGSEFWRRGLLQLSEREIPSSVSSAISIEERRQEQAQITKGLQEAFERERPRLLKDLATVAVYSKLSGTTGSIHALKPIERLESREAYFKQNLEIWPADDGEEWIDEIGRHRFIGEALCTEEKES